jgi:hypothetical protein
MKLDAEMDAYQQQKYVNEYQEKISKSNRNKNEFDTVNRKLIEEKQMKEKVLLNLLKYRNIKRNVKLM